MPKNVLIIGAVALGPKAACRLKRLEPDSNIIMVDQSDLISYGGCGIPYFVSGDVSEAQQLQETSFHMLRDEKFFRQVKDVDVMVNTRAVSIDRGNKTVQVKNILSGKEQELIFVGIDVIGDWLTEINVTSPTGLQGINAHDGVKLEANIMDAVEAKVCN